MLIVLAFYMYTDAFNGSPMVEIKRIYNLIVNNVNKQLLNVHNVQS